MDRAEWMGRRGGGGNNNLIKFRDIWLIVKYEHFLIVRAFLVWLLQNKVVENGDGEMDGKTKLGVWKMKNKMTVNKCCVT